MTDQGGRETADRKARDRVTLFGAGLHELFQSAFLLPEGGQVAQGGLDQNGQHHALGLTDKAGAMEG